MSSVPQEDREPEPQFTIPPSLHSYLQLARDAARLFEQTSNPLALDDAIHAWEHILAHADFASADPGFRLVVFNDCAGSFLRRYLIKNTLEDINRAVHFMQDALEQIPPAMPLPSRLLVNLSEVLLMRYRHAPAAYEGDLDQAIELYKQALALTPETAPDFPARLAKLANALESRYQRIHDFSALEAAILYHKQAIERTPFADSAFPERLNNLGDCLRTRYLYSNEKGDLDQAIACAELVAQFHTLDPLESAGYLNNLGNVLRNRYEAYSTSVDLERAIQIYREAVAGVPTHSPYDSMFVHNLGVALRDRYYLLGERADLVEAMDHLQRAVDTAPLQSELRPGYLSDLGTAFDDWFQHTGALEELERSIQTHWQAVRQTPENAPALGLHWNNLGNALRNLATRSAKEADLTQAIEAYREAVAHTPPSSYYYASRLNNLANALKDRFIRTSAIEDLQQSVQFYEQALKLLQPGATEYIIVLGNLAGSLYTRYLLNKEPADLDRAIALWQETIERAPTDSPYLPSQWNNMGQALRIRYQNFCDPQDWEKAVGAWKRAIERGKEVTAYVALSSARNWGNWAFEQEQWSEACEAYEVAHMIIRHLLSLQVLRHNKESWLREVQQTFAQAAYALAKEGRLEEAVIAMEEGRAYLLTESLERNRAELQRLQDIGHGELYERYQQAITDWEKLSKGLYLGEDTFSAKIPSTQSIRAAREKLDSVIALLRMVPGYEDFFASPPFSRIHASIFPASSLVYILVTEHGGLALHLQAETPAVTPLFLPGLKETVVRQKVVEMSTALEAYTRGDRAMQSSCFQQMDTITHWLWSVVMGDMIEVFSLKSTVALIATGLLALLPLQAAWTNDSNNLTKRRYALDHLTFTSIPNARALTAARERTLQASGDGLLIVDDPQPVAEPLGTEGYETEFARLLFPRFRLLRHEQATLDTVLKEMLLYPIWHFNCHGYADVVNPLASGLLMAEKHPLTLQHLLDLHLSDARLAVLSACETALPGITLPNEVISLPMGLLQAGFVGVIASLWKVEYTSTMLLMIRFYDLWRKQAVAAPEALRQAQLWLRDTTTSQKLAYIEQFSMEEGLSPEKAHQLYEYVFIHMPRTCAPPYYWAAFNYTGI